MFFFTSFSSVSDVRDATSATTPAARRASSSRLPGTMQPYRRRVVACLIARGPAFNRTVMPKRASMTFDKLLFFLYLHFCPVLTSTQIFFTHLTIIDRKISFY